MTCTFSCDIAYSERASVQRGTLGGIKAPMIQNRGRKIPRMNITQCPFRIVRIPSVASSTKYKIPPPMNNHSIGISFV
jgi:hypothetical protein